MARIFTVVALALATSPAAQQLEARFTRQRLTIEISYGAVRLGKHSLEELPPGRHWALGAGSVTTLTTRMPIVRGEDILPPGSYRLRVHRATEKEFALVADGSTGDRIRLPGAFGAEHRPNKKLEITFGKPRKAQTPALHTSEVMVHFGPYRLAAPFAVPDSERRKARGYTVHAFTWPTTVLDKQLGKKPLPVATLTPTRPPGKGEPEFFNLLLTEEEFVLAPAPRAPRVSRRGRGGGAGGAQEAAASPVQERRGAIQWTRDQAEVGRFEITRLKVANDGSIDIEVRFGDRVGTGEIPAPERRPRR